MDIRKWLDQVEDGDAAPVQMTRRGDQKHSQHKKRLNVATDTGQQKRHRSDSSLLEPRPALQQEAPRRTKQATEESVDNCSSDHAPTHTNTDSESQNQPYARRARRKTRPDRYDPYPKKSKEAEPGTHRRKKGESKRSRRKTKNKKDEKSGNVLAQSFHAKNVSGDRLTVRADVHAAVYSLADDWAQLKPREQLGLFNKGKTSTAVKGRGRKLDLLQHVA